MQGGALASPQDFLRDKIPVDGHAEGAPDARIGERLAGSMVGRLRPLDVAIDPDVRGGEERVEPQLRGLLRAQLGDLVRRHRAGDVQLAAAERAFLGEEIGDRSEFHGVEGDFRGIPIERITADDDAAGHFPFL